MAGKKGEGTHPEQSERIVSSVCESSRVQSSAFGPDIRSIGTVSDGDDLCQCG